MIPWDNSAMHCTPHQALLVLRCNKILEGMLGIKIQQTILHKDCKYLLDMQQPMWKQNLLRNSNQPRK